MPSPSRSAALLAAAGACAVYWRTAYPSIAWWDSSSYSLAAATLGVTSSPGSLLLTLLGWAATRLPSGLPPARALNLLAGALAPAAYLLGNWRARDASDRWFARDYAANVLRTLPPNAIHLTVGDNDTFPLWYLQAAEGVRPDVRVANLSLLNTSWYVRQLARRAPPLPVSRVPDGRADDPPRASLPDSAVVIPVARTAEQLALPPGTRVPDAVTVTPRPLYGDTPLPADAVLLDVVRTNAWRDPLTVSLTAGRETLGWLAPYARLEGLHWRVVPVAGLGADTERLRANLLTRHAYRGYADPTLPLDADTRNIGALYLTALDGLLEAAESGGGDACREARAVARRVLAALPPARLGVPARDRAAMEARCAAR